MFGSDYKNIQRPTTEIPVFLILERHSGAEAATRRTSSHQTGREKISESTKTSKHRSYACGLHDHVSGASVRDASPHASGMRGSETGQVLGW